MRSPGCSDGQTSEGMCAALLEAMGLGTPVLARAVPGNRAIVQHGRTGLLFATPGEAVALAAAVLDGGSSASSLPNGQSLPSTILRAHYRFRHPLIPNQALSTETKSPQMPRPMLNGTARVV